MNYPNIINIQRYSVHDGDGIRTTIFFKGCPLKCIWCHNPESQSYKEEFLFDYEKCTGCGYCIKACHTGAISLDDSHKAVTDESKCVLCEECFDYCVQNAREKAGRTYEIDELVNICLKDKPFYEESGGGVTLSGGEVMSQDIEYIENLCIKLKEKGLNIAIDTCGYASKLSFKRILPYADTFLYDIKVLDENKHIKYTGRSNDIILQNLKYIASQNANINIRIPVVKDVNSDYESMMDIIDFLKENTGIVPVNLLPYHNTGKSKYAKLKRTYEGNELQAPSAEELSKLVKLFNDNGFNKVRIGG